MMHRILMIEYSDQRLHACMIQNSETDWMRARGQPASTRAWPAASGQLAGFHFASARVLGGSKHYRRARMPWVRYRLHLRAPVVFRST